MSVAELALSDTVDSVLSTSTLDEALTAFAARRLVNVEYRYVMVDARYEKVRATASIRILAEQIAVGRYGHRGSTSYAGG